MGSDNAFPRWTHSSARLERLPNMPFRNAIHTNPLRKIPKNERLSGRAGDGRQLSPNKPTAQKRHSRTPNHFESALGGSSSRLLRSRSALRALQCMYSNSGGGRSGGRRPGASIQSSRSAEEAMHKCFGSGINRNLQTQAIFENGSMRPGFIRRKKIPSAESS